VFCNVCCLLQVVSVMGYYSRRMGTRLLEGAVAEIEKVGGKVLACSRARQRGFWNISEVYPNPNLG